MDDYKLKIHNSFSSKAESYDAYAKIQKVVAERMIAVSYTHLTLPTILRV